jgi:hypothetical protein
VKEDYEVRARRSGQNDIVSHPEQAEIENGNFASVGATAGGFFSIRRQ